MEKTGQPRSISIRRWGGVIAGVLGLAGLTWYIAQYSSEFHRLREISVLNIVMLSCIVLLGHFFIALRLQLMAGAFDARLLLWEAILLIEAGGFLNIVPLNLGTGFRAAYLKKVRKLKFVDFGLGFLGSLLAEFVVAGSLGLFFSLSLSGTSPVLRVVFLAYILAPLGLLALAWVFRRSARFQALTQLEARNWFGRLFRSLVSGLETILDQPQTILYLFILNLLTDFVLGIRYWLVGAWLGYPVNFASGMVLQSAARATAVVTIMPSGTIGLREALTGLGAAGLGESAVSGVMISTIDRIVATAWIVLLGSISLFILRNKIAQASLSAPITESQI